jgi:hypothetical protein
MKARPVSRRRTLADRVSGLVFIGILLYIARLAWTGQLGEKLQALADWLWQVFA